MTFEDLRRKRARWDLALVILAAGLLFGRHYDIEDLFAYVPDDAYQSLADAFRNGRIAVIEDAERIHQDTAPVGDDAHVVWGPAPAVGYAALDAVCALLGLPPFPKALLYFATSVVHLYLILLLSRGLLGDRAWLPRLATVCYAFSYPFCFAASEATRVNWVSVLVAATLLLGGFHLLRRSLQDPDHPGSLAGPAALVVLAGLTRAVTFLALGLIALVVLSGRPLRRRHAIFFGIAASGVVLLLWYNAMRFGNPLTLGDGLIYQSNWDEEVASKGVLPFDSFRILARWGEAVFAFLGAPQPPWGRPVDTLYRYHQTYIGILVLPFVGAILAAAPGWFRKARRHATELALAGTATVFILFYLTWMNEFEIRYQMDYVPLLFLAGLKAASDAAGARRRWLAAPAVVVTALTAVALHAALADRVIAAHGIDPPTVSPYHHRMDRQIPGMWFFSGHPVGRSIRCEAIPTVHESASDLPMRQESLDRLGIFRFPGHRCEMVFFSGGTLRLDPDRDCRIELFLDPDDLDDCGRVTLYRDGRPAGRMTEAQTDRKGQRLCVFPLGITGERLVQAYFLFEPVPRRSTDWLRATRRYGMTELRAECGEP